MPKRFELLVNNEIYHVYNRSSWNQELFVSTKELKRVLELVNYYRFNQPLRFSKFKILSQIRKEEYFKNIKKKSPLIEIFAFAFMPDHYHLLIRQNVDNGIRIFISNFQNAFAKYFNIKNKNRGSLFINPFKSKRIKNDEYFLHVSRYIHLNPVTSYLIEMKQLETDLRTSFPFYISKVKDDFVNTMFIIKLIGSKKSYIKFLSDQVDYQRKLRLLRRFIFE